MTISPIAIVLALAFVSPLSVALTNVALAAAVVATAVAVRRGGYHVVSTPIDAAVLFWMASAVLAAATSLDPLASVEDLKSLLPWALTWIVASALLQGGSLRKFENLWIAGAVIASLHALLQGTLGVDLRGEAGGTPRGFFGGHLHFAHYAILVLALLLERLAVDRGRSRLWVAASFAVVLAAFVATKGRGPYLAFAGVLAAWTLWQPRRLRMALPVAAVTAVLVLGVAALQPGGIRDFARSYVDVAPTADVDENVDRHYSNLWRVAMWTEGLRLHVTRPVLGIGGDSIRDLSRDFRSRFSDFGVAHLHSNYVEALVSRGLVGLTAFLFLIFATLEVFTRVSAREIPRELRPAVFTGIAVAVSHAIHGVTYYSIEKAPIRMGTALALGMAVAALLRAEGSSGRPFRPPISGTAVAWGLFTIAGLLLVSAWIPMQPAAAAGLSGLVLADFAWRAGRGRVTVLEVSIVLAGAVSALLAIVWLLPTHAGAHTAVPHLATTGFLVPLAYGSVRAFPFRLKGRSPNR